MRDQVGLRGVSNDRAVDSGLHMRPFRAAGGLCINLTLAVRLPAGLLRRGGKPELGVECAVIGAGQPVGRCGHYRAAPVDQDVVDGEQGEAPAGSWSPGQGQPVANLAGGVRVAAAQERRNCA